MATKENNGHDGDYKSFFDTQLKTYHAIKVMIARYIIHEFDIPTGSGLIFDAGTSCSLVFEELVQHIINKKIDPFFSILTNSLPVILNWQGHLHHSKIREIQIDLYGSRLDADHNALYDSSLFQDETEKKLLSKNFRARHVYIGSSGIEFTKDGRFLFGTHAVQERKPKELLFKCSGKIRFILLTPNKIGAAGGCVFDIFDIQDIDTEAPIVLLSTSPETSLDALRDKKTREIFNSAEIQQKARDKGLVIHWLTLGTEKNGYPISNHEVIPYDENGDNEKLKRALFEIV